MKSMDPVKLRFYIERYQKENQNLHLNEKFIRTSLIKPVTGKFYGTHDAFSKDDIKEEYIKLVERRTIFTPKDIYTFRPPSTNMEYGWFTEPLIPKTSDSRLFFPRKECEFIKTERALQQLQKNIPVKKFTGVPFRT